MSKDAIDKLITELTDYIIITYRLEESQAVEDAMAQIRSRDMLKTALIKALQLYVE